MFLNFNNSKNMLSLTRSARKEDNNKGPSTKDVRQMGRGGGGGFEISDIPGRGEGGGGVVVCESSDVRKFLKKPKFQNFSELFKVKTINYNRSRFQYKSIHI